MEYPNPRNADSIGGNRSSNSRMLVLAALLAVLALICGLYTFPRRYNAKAEKQTDDEYSVFMASVAKADAIVDPLQRCLSYPDLPGSHWDAETTRAYCELRSHKTIRLVEIEALLKQGKAGEVDQIFQTYLDTQRHDPKQPGLLDIAFLNAGFYEANDNTRRILDTWKLQSPNSAFAFGASGVQYVDAAQKARGNGWSRDLTDQQEEGMDQQLELAVKDLNRAVSLNASVTAIFPYMIHAGGLTDSRYMYRSAQLGLEADPSNFAIRLQMMNQAQEKWGARFGGVAEQRREDISLSSRNPLLRMVAQLPAFYQATCDCDYGQKQVHQLVLRAADKNLTAADMAGLVYKVYDTDRRLAVELYSEALRFAPDDDVDVLRWRSQEMIALGDRVGAIESFAAVARRFPDNLAIATQLGNIYAQAGDAKGAETTLLAVLARDPHNYDAMGVLGDLYNHAGHQPQKAEALADAMIREYPEQAGGYIVRSCNQMDHNLPGVYDTIHYFIDHFGDDPQWKTQTAEMRAYLIKHPEKMGPS